ncbi:MAG TPA: hypothetical protein PKI03_28030, partial [Pseudomonadota bacterium]|nr:hypothetical protein [Pseudomonadota bacterium]
MAFHGDMLQYLVSLSLVGPALAAMSTLGTIDRGIYSELGPQAQISAPGWAVSGGERWLRVDLPHRLVTLYQGDVALTAYAIATPPSLSTPPTPSSEASAILPWLAERDRADL